MQEILIRVENNQNNDLFKSVDFIKNNVQKVEIMSDSNNVKLYFDTPPPQDNDCKETLNKSCHDDISTCETVSRMTKSIGSLLTLRSSDEDSESISDSNELALFKSEPKSAEATIKVLSLYEELVRYMRYFKKTVVKYTPISETFVDPFIDYAAISIFGFTLLYVCGKKCHMCYNKLAYLIKSILTEPALLENDKVVNFLKMEFSVDDHLHNEFYSSTMDTSQLTTFKGLYKQKPVAIRRYENDINDNGAQIFVPSYAFNQKMNVLNSLPYNKHIIKCVGSETGIRYSYIITELHSQNLMQWFQNNAALGVNTTFETKINMVYQLLKGLKHLHLNEYAHGKLNPKNILVDVDKNSNDVKVVISDLSSCRFLDNHTPILPQTTDNQTKPKDSNIYEKRSSSKDYFNDTPILTDALKHKAMDVYDFGVLLLFIICDGKLPDYFLHVIKNYYTPSRSQIESILPPDCKSSEEEIIDFVMSCFRSDLTGRACVSQLSNHPIFWNIEYKGSFITEISNFIEKMSTTYFIMKKLESYESGPIRENWIENVDNEIIKDAVRHRSYRGDSIKDLLRVIRNKRSHYKDTCIQVANKFGTANQLTEYFVRQFPKLIIYVYNVFRKHRPEKSPSLDKFF